MPGQRRAALHWNEFFEETVQESGFESFEAMPTVFRHSIRKMFLPVHVDDVLLVGSTFDCKWCLDELSKKFSLKSNGPFPAGKDAELEYLKKNILVTSDGIIMEPCKQYIPKLLELLGVENRREKACPHHNNLDVYDRERIMTKELLNQEQTRVFRGGLGLCLYLAQDRPDIQEAVRVLSTYMGSPTIRAMSALKHLACYLKNTRDFGVHLSNCSVGGVLRDNWSHVENMHEESGTFNLECYCDSNWAGSKVTRKSTTSGMVFLNGNLILSMCKTQATVALSSCEAELMAITHMTAESIMISNVCRFLLKIPGYAISPEFDFVVYTDSSSAKSIAQRRGVGRLKHLDIRLLWIQRFVKERFLRLKKIATVDNVADLNTKNLTSTRRQYLFSLVGMSDNQTRIQMTQTNAVHVPRSVHRILAVLAGLPMGTSQTIGVGMLDDGTVQWWQVISFLILLGGMVTLCFMMSNAGHGRNADEDEMEEVLIEEDDEDPYGTIDEPRIPPEEEARPRHLPVQGLRDQLLRCLAMAGEMWATICEGSQYERGAVPRWRGREAAESARRADRDGTTLFQLELITKALVDGKLEPAQDCLLLAGSDEQDPMILVRGIDDLRNIYPECTQRGFQEHGKYLYEVHGDYVADRGYNMELIRASLGIPEPDGDEVDVGSEVEPEPEGLMDDRSAHSSMCEDSRFTVENAEDWRIRYLAFPMEECSDPEYWQSLRHHDGPDDNCSEAEG